MNAPIWIPAIIHSLLIALIGTFLLFVPRRTRPDLWFAVTVAPGFRDTPEARAVERRYRGQVVLHTALSLAIVGGLCGLGLPIASPLATLWLFGGSMAAFLSARRQTLPHAVVPDTTREAVLRRPPAPYLPVAVHLGPFLILGASALWLRSQWDRVPARVPLHWNLAGEVNRWGEKSVGTVFGPLFIGASMCVLMIALGFLIGRARHVHATGAAAQHDATFRRMMLWVLLGGEYLLAITFSWLPALMLGGSVTPYLWTTLSLVVVFVAALMTASLYFGQGGAALGPAGTSGRAVGDRTADARWKFGMFYVNPDDPALIVEKRFGVGYTLNMGHAGAWALLAFTVVLPIVLSLLLVRTSH